MKHNEWKIVIAHVLLMMTVHANGQLGLGCPHELYEIAMIYSKVVKQCTQLQITLVITCVV